MSQPIQLNSVVDTDPVAIEILRGIYTSLKNKNSEELNLEEKKWLQEIERSYKIQMKNILEQVYDILYKKEEAWQPPDDELYSLLERIVFLKARDGTFHHFFDNMEQVIESASRLDFSKRVPLSHFSADQRNLFNYAVTCLNILVEKMETSVVSMKAVNTLLSAIPGIMMIVTDSNGTMRFVNDLAEKLLGLKKNEYLGKSIYLLMEEHEQVNKEYLSHGEIKNRRVNLIIPGNEKKALSVFLTIPKSYQDHTEIEEVVYAITIDHPLQGSEENQFNLTQEFHDKIAPLNTIIGAVNLLNSRFNDNEGKMLMNAIKSSAEKVKAASTDALNAIAAKTSNFSELNSISIADVVDDVLNGLKFNEGFNEIKFDIDIDYSNQLYANRKLIHSIFQNLISNAIKYRNKDEPVIRLSVNDVSNTGLRIRLSDNGVGINEEYQTNIFEKSFQTSVQNEGHGMGLYLVKEAVKKLKGIINLESIPGKGTTFTIQISCGNQPEKTGEV